MGAVQVGHCVADRGHGRTLKPVLPLVKQAHDPRDWVQPQVGANVRIAQPTATQQHGTVQGAACRHHRARANRHALRAAAPRARALHAHRAAALHEHPVRAALVEETRPIACGVPQPREHRALLAPRLGRPRVAALAPAPAHRVLGRHLRFPAVPQRGWGR